jgi:hypothetical protein
MYDGWLETKPRRRPLENPTFAGLSEAGCGTTQSNVITLLIRTLGASPFGFRSGAAARSCAWAMAGCAGKVPVTLSAPMMSRRSKPWLDPKSPSLQICVR